MTAGARRPLAERRLVRSYWSGTDLGCPVAAAVVDASATSPGVRAAAGAAFGSWAEELGADGELVLAALEGAILLARAHDDPEVVTRVGRALAARLG